MCRSKIEGGRRCANELCRKMAGLNENIAIYEQAIRDARTPRANESVEERDARQERLWDLEKSAIATKADRAEVQRQLNATPSGMAALEDRMADENLTAGERAQARWDLEQARKDAEDRNAKATDYRNAAKALTTELEALGVPRARIQSILSLASGDSGIPTIRSYAYYEKALGASRAKHKALQAEHEEIEDEILNRGLPIDKEDVLLEAERLRHMEASRKVNERIAHYSLGRDSTVRGQAELLKRTEQRYEDLSELREAAEHRKDLASANKFAAQAAEYAARQQVRQERVQRLHQTAMAERKRREIVRAEIKAVAKEYGGDPDAVLDVWKKPPLTVSDQMDPADLRRGAKVHVTEKDAEAIQSAFKRSEEFQNHGEDGFHAYARRVVFTSPLSRMDRTTTIPELHAKAEIFDQGKKGRHKTAAVGRREVAQTISLTSHEQGIIKARASALEMTSSSYMRAMLTGGNPLQIQNDRSKENWQKKRDACRVVLAQPEVLAA